MGFVYLVFAFILNSAANILLKLAAEKGLRLNANPLVLVRDNWLLVAALASFGLNFVCYFFALRGVALSVAYPVMNVMSILIVYAFTVWYFHEQLTIVQTIGYGLLIAGLVLIFYFGKK